MMKLRVLRSRGLGIVEILMTAGIFAVLGVAVLEFLSRQSDFYEVSTTQMDVRSEVQRALDEMVRELRQATRTTQPLGVAPNVSIPAAPDNTTITFYLPQDGADVNTTIMDDIGNIEWGTPPLVPIQYQRNAITQQLLRLQGVAQRTLAQNVTSVVFADRAIDATLAENEVRITLTIQRTTPRQRPVAASSTAIVKLRN